MKNAVTTDKAAKRPYVKKSLRTQDELWKAIVPLLWAPFLRFCLEDWVDKIDFTHKPDFLDKELKRIMLRAKVKNRAVDFLMRLYMKDGTTKYFLLHVEVQGYPDEYFRKRVFQYYYRISDLLDEPLETLAIMIDDDPDWRPNEYIQRLGQTEVHFKFGMFKLLDNPPPYVGKEDNPFSVVFEVAWYGLKQNMLKSDEDLNTLKFRLMKRLLENGVDDETIYAMLDFINIYLPFKKSEKELTFEREIELFIDKEKNMEAATIRELRDRHIRENERKIIKNEFKKELEKERKIAKKEARMRQEAETRRQEEARMRQEEARMRQEEARMRQEEARMRQEAETRRQEEARMRQEKLATVIVKLYNQGFSAEDIADMQLEPLALVEDIIGKHFGSVLA